MLSMGLAWRTTVAGKQVRTGSTYHGLFPCKNKFRSHGKIDLQNESKGSPAAAASCGTHEKLCCLRRLNLSVIRTKLSSLHRTASFLYRRRSARLPRSFVHQSKALESIPFHPYGQRWKNSSWLSVILMKAATSRYSQMSLLEGLHTPPFTPNTRFTPDSSSIEGATPGTSVL